MTTPPPPWLIQPLDLSQFQPAFQNTDPGFTQLVNDTLDDLATPADGFDEVMSEAIGLLDGLDAALGILEGDFSTLFDEAQQIDPQPYTDTATALGTSTDAMNGAVDALGDQVSRLAPQPAPQPAPPPTPAPASACADGSIVAGLVIGQPDPNPYPAVTFVQLGAIRWVSLGTVCVGSPVDTEDVAHGSWTMDDYLNGAPDDGDLAYGDPAIFTERDTQDFTSGTDEKWAVYLDIAPTKPGRFQAVVTHPTGHLGLRPGSSILLQPVGQTGYRITIVEKPAS